MLQQFFVGRGASLTFPMIRVTFLMFMVVKHALHCATCRMALFFYFCVG